MNAAASGGGGGGGDDDDDDDSRGLDKGNYDDDGYATQTSEVQVKLENEIARIYLELSTQRYATRFKLHRLNHIRFLLKALHGLNENFQSMDASQPWFVFWILQSLDLLDAMDKVNKKSIIDFLGRCQDSQGGFGGGPHQLPHLAPTYASVHSLAILGCVDAYSLINRKKMYKFLIGLKCSDGGFRLHKDGEVDVRGTYCAISVAKLLNILTPALVSGVADFVSRCQTYEGGFGGLPGNEAHSGYTYCGLCALVLLGEAACINVEKLLHWCCDRQMKTEGGFQGRTNKLVDVCYSFWHGALFFVFDKYLWPNEENRSERPMFSEFDSQKYILLASQELIGGFRDKPGKYRDIYHTCYALCGLSVTQHCLFDAIPRVLGPQDNILPQIDCLHNIRVEKAEEIISYFQKYSCKG